MKIRTITVGFNYQKEMNNHDIKRIADRICKIKKYFEKKHYLVQTIRMSTQPWHNYAQTKTELISQVQKLHRRINKNHIDYFNIGPTNKLECVSWLPKVLESSNNVFCTVNICNQNDINYEIIKETAKVIKKNAKLESQGFANLRFAALCNIPPNTPFYPASYHSNTSPSFGIGLENSDLVYQAFKQVGSIQLAKKSLKRKLIDTYEPIASLAEDISKKYKIKYDGIDVSICTSLGKQESIAYAFEHLQDNYIFGQPGTLSIAKIITDTIQQLPIKTTGYCGLMLPVLEDDGLANRNTEHSFSITNLLLYSAICGTGLDTIPLPGTVSIQELENILLDVASLSIKLRKPLSARLMPIPNKKSGDLTNYDFSYFKNSVVMSQR